MQIARLSVIFILLSMFFLNASAQIQYTENVEPDASKENKDMIFQPGQKAVSEHYAGDVYISGLLRNTGYDINQLVFEAGSHNDWHIHPNTSQVLLILDGEGYYQE